MNSLLRSIRLWTALVLYILLTDFVVSPAAFCQRSEEGVLTTEPLEFRLRRHVEILAAEIGERNIWNPSLMQAAVSYIDNQWRSMGYRLISEEYRAADETMVKNLWVEVRGKGQPEQIIVVGAHYDTVLGSPGADDNGSGVAALLELSRFMRELSPHTTMRFVAFANEEPPFFLSKKMGSRVHAIKARRERQPIVGMISLESLACYTSARNSQKYPFPLGMLYPETGNFIGFVSNLGSWRLMKTILDSFRHHASFPAHGLAAPGWMTGVGWSDHWSFWQEGFPAMMVTDTALFRYRPYHTPMDTPEKLDYSSFAQVVEGLRKVFIDLSGAVLTPR